MPSCLLEWWHCISTSSEWVSVALHSCQQWILSFFFFFLILVLLIILWCYLIVDLICISLMTKDVEYVFIFLFAIVYLLWWSVQIFCLFLNCVVWFLLLTFRLLVYFGYKYFNRYVICKYFPQHVACHCILLIVSLQKSS